MRIFLSCLLLIAGTWKVRADDAIATSPLQSGKFHWTTGTPVASPPSRQGDPCHSIKDPTVVRYQGRWHLFCTVRGEKRSHRIEYLTFADWKDVAAAKRQFLTFNDGYFCAPQVFYYTPQRRWYLLHQMADPSRKPSLQPAFSTTDNIADPASWSKPQLLFAKQPDNVGRWIDFWVICDKQHAHLFFTSLDGRMWRSETPREKFPGDWSRPQIVLQGDIFEASHTYKLRGRDQYLTLVEAQAGGRRYYKAYLADRLGGPWRPLAASREKPFASPVNVEFTGQRWTDSFSHGELIRAGYDEHLEVDPEKLEFLFQGVTDKAKQGRRYGDIPWRLGILRPAP